MSSRQEEKEQRRKEREALEAAAAAKASRKQRLQLGLGALLTIAAIAAAVVVFSTGKDTEFDGTPTTPDAAAVKLPPLAEADLGKALKAAKCVQKSPAIEGSTHTSEPVTYKNSNPPASGDHFPVAPDDGFYEAGNEPPTEHWVHSLEHGRIIIQYRPGTPKATVDKLEAVGNEEMNGSPGYHVLAMQNNTEMDAAVAVVGWGQVATCAEMSDGVFDVIRNFRREYTDKAPELIP